MMLDILMTNRENVARMIRACSSHLSELADQIETGDESTLRVHLESAAASRRHLKFDAPALHAGAGV